MQLDLSSPNLPSILNPKTLSHKTISSSVKTRPRSVKKFMIYVVPKIG